MKWTLQLPDPFEDSFWREQLTPEQQAGRRRDRAKEIIEKANMGPIARPAAPPRRRDPTFDQVHERFELDYSRTNYVEGGAGVKISRVLAEQFHVKLDPLPAYVDSGGDPDGDADLY